MKWTAHKNSAWGNMLEISNQDGDSVAYFHHEDDARLAALAPEMREALEKLARLGNEPELGNSDGNMIARAVLAKLEGKS